MEIEKSRSIQRGIFPVLRALTAFPIACFSCALCTDAAYWRTANVMWVDFSAWLLAVGMAGGILALVVGLVSWMFGHRGISDRRAWLMTIGSILVLMIGMLNNFVHSRDGWTSVVPDGLALSVLTVLVMLALAWFRSSVNEPRVVAQPTFGVRR